MRVVVMFEQFSDDWFPGMGLANLSGRELASHAIGQRFRSAEGIQDSVFTP